MSLTVVDLHDVALTVTTDGDVRARSPGAAVLDGGRALTGHAALAHLERRPRAVFRQFWQTLDETPLADGDRRCRHHADLAWAHLRETLAAAGAPRRAVLAVPGHYDDAQLGLLLGIAAAAGLAVDALVDSAVAAIAGCAAPGTFRVVDLRQGHVLVTDVAVDGQWAERLAVSELTGTGLLDVHRAAADIAAAALLRDARFDALHDATSAAELRAQVPAWLAQAAVGEPVEIAVTAGPRRHATQVPATAFAALGMSLARMLAPRLAGAATVVLTEHLAALPGVRAALAPAEVLPVAALWRGVSAHGQLSRPHAHAGTGLYTTWPAAPAATLAALPARPRQNAMRPTHVLAGGAAHAVGATTLFLYADGSVSRTSDARACAALEAVQHSLMLTPLVDSVLCNGRPLDAACEVAAGDHIVCGAGRAHFMPIAVED